MNDFVSPRPAADGARAELAAVIADPTPEVLAGLHEQLVARADAEGVLDLTYRTVDTPIGSLLLAATPEGLVRVAFEREGHAVVLDQLARTVSPRILRSGRRTDDAARQLEEYFAGRRRAFDLPVDLRLARGFRRAVLQHLWQDVGYGSTATYASLAAAAGHPRAVRAAGTACARNPVPVVVPCHRVVRSDGSLGQYLAGVEVKAALLALEGAA